MEAATDTRRKCPNCGFMNSAAAKHCINCGSSMEELPVVDRHKVEGAEGTPIAAPDNGVKKA